MLLNVVQGLVNETLKWCFSLDVNKPDSRLLFLSSQEVITNEHVVEMMKAAIRETQDLPLFVSVSFFLLFFFLWRAHIKHYNCEHLVWSGWNWVQTLYSILKVHKRLSYCKCTESLYICNYFCIPRISNHSTGRLQIRAETVGHAVVQNRQ